MLTRKDYIQLADMLNKLSNKPHPSATALMQDLMIELCIFLKRNNHRFDKHRFESAVYKVESER